MPSSPFLRPTALRVLGSGFLLTFLSGFGQTFFIGLFGDELRTAASLGLGGFGTAYSGATLASAVCMIWVGALIDRLPLPLFAAGALLLLAVGCLLVGFAGHGLVLAAAIFLLRFGGQGLLPHTAVTSTARSFDRARGKALSFTLLGHPAGEALLPLAAVAVAAAAGWQTVWVGAAAVLVLTVPIFAWLARSSDRGSAKRVATTGTTATSRVRAIGAVRQEVLRDRRFHLLLPTLLLPGFIVTGVFVHQGHLVEEKGWTLAWFASSFVAFALAHVAGTLASGPLIDRFSARRLAPYYSLPFAVACIAINVTDDPLIALAFMAGSGVTIGAAASTVTALFAEIYGVAHLGAVRALAISTMIMATALAPAIFGWLFELGVGFGPILLACAGAIVVAMFLARVAVALAARPEAGSA